MNNSLKSLLDRCLLPLSVKELVDLVEVPWDQWPAAAKEPWWWLENTRAESTTGGQWHRARAIVPHEGRTISPARLLFEFFTKTELPIKQRLVYHLRGVRGAQHDDVNPTHYKLATPKKIATRKNVMKPRVIADIVQLMELANFWPTTIAELLDRWPEMKNHKEDDLNETIKSEAL